jgi:hypothetical protein
VNITVDFLLPYIGQLQLQNLLIEVNHRALLGILKCLACFHLDIQSIISSYFIYLGHFRACCCSIAASWHDGDIFLVNAPAQHTEWLRGHTREPIRSAHVPRLASSLLFFLLCSTSKEESVRLHVMLQYLYNLNFTLFTFFYLSSPLISSPLFSSLSCMHAHLCSLSLSS